MINFSEHWCPDCGHTGMDEYNAKYSFGVACRCPQTGNEIKDSVEVEHIALKCGVCGLELIDYRGEDARFAVQRDWIFEKTGILIDELGNEIN